MNFSIQQYHNYQRKRGLKPLEPTAQVGVDHEISELHKPIERWCQDNRVPYIHSRTDKPSTVAAGAPDFAIFCNGRCILVECKTRVGKLSPDQLAWKFMAERQQTEVHIVRKMEDFWRLIS